MKKVSLIIIAFGFFGLIGEKVNAQNLKFGHINSEELLQSLPEVDSATANLERLNRELSNAYELMQVDLNNLFEALNRDSKNLTDIVRQNKEQEVTDKQRRLLEFQQSAQRQLEERQAQLLQPIMEKVDKAIKDVGKENGFIYVFIIGQGSSVIYFDEAKSVDIMSLTKAKLGVK